VAKATGDFLQPAPLACKLRGPCLFCASFKLRHVYDSKAELMPVSNLLEKVAPGAASFGMNEKSPHIHVYTPVKTGIS